MTAQDEILGERRSQRKQVIASNDGHQQCQEGIPPLQHATAHQSNANNHTSVCVYVCVFVSVSVSVSVSVAVSVAVAVAVSVCF